MKKTLSPAQQRQREERRNKFAGIVEQIGAMSDTERAALAARISVTNTEGHALSVRNQMLIALQLGIHATIVGGFRQWLKQGRCVRKGEHGATILFPRTFGDKAGEQDGTTAAVTAAEAESPSPVRFLSGTVFDISQTVILDESEKPVTDVPLFVPPPPAESSAAPAVAPVKELQFELVA